MIELILMGIFLGSIYALMGLGFSLIFAGVRGTMNIAHGALAILGAYLCLLFAERGLDPLIGMIPVIPIVFIIGYAIQRVLVNKVIYGDPNVVSLLLIGVSVIVENLAILIWSANPKSLTVFAPYAIQGITILGRTVPINYVINFFISIVTIIIYYLFLKKTFTGMAIRATSVGHVYAQLLGVNPKKTYAYTYALGTIATGLAGVLMGLTFTFVPSNSLDWLTIAFGVVVLGGLGSMRGVLAGGLIIGLSHVLSAYYLGVQYQLLLGYIVILIVLALRPEGIFGYKV
ncbi:MAG: branched-chain amino acid ABC transporter permease [Candidatus Bathyarchaeia archaeon]|nr:branched-chain amino acid ABC transporter permease [Candidatus Bathyarchaeota archaeon]